MTLVGFIYIYKKSYKHLRVVSVFAPFVNLNHCKMSNSYEHILFMHIRM